MNSISPLAIQSKVKQLAKEVAEYNPEVLVMIMTAAVPFASDLLKELSKLGVDCRVGWMDCHRTGKHDAFIVSSSLPFIEGRRVLVVDCIFDSGTTMRKCVSSLLHHELAAKVKSACLLWRNCVGASSRPHFWGFNLEGAPGFLVGYGLDGEGGFGRGRNWIEVAESKRVAVQG